jgi:hypothetical protein
LDDNKLDFREKHHANLSINQQIKMKVRHCLRPSIVRERYGEINACGHQRIKTLPQLKMPPNNLLRLKNPKTQWILSFVNYGVDVKLR